MVTSFLTIATAPAVGAAELVDVNVGLSGDDGVVITWETDVATSAAIVYGTTPEYGEAWLDPAISTTHSAQLSGLECETDYHFSIVSTDENDVSSNSGPLGFRSGPCATGEGIAPVAVVAYQETAIVTYGSEQPGRGTIVFGPTTEFGSAVAEPNQLVTFHRLELVGLTCDTTYYFAGLTEAADGSVESTGPQSFTTYACDPFVNDVDVLAGTTTATITWTTDAPASASMIIGETTAYGQEVLAGVDTDLHRIDLVDLSCDASYHYRVIAYDAEGTAHWTPDVSFSTAPCEDVDPLPGIPGGGPAVDPAPVLGPVVVDAGETTAAINWTTSELTSGSIVWGETNTYGNETVTYLISDAHRVDLGDLTCDTEYHLTALSAGPTGVVASSGNVTFRTLSCGSGIEIAPPVVEPPVSEPPATEEPTPEPPLSDEPPVAEEPPVVEPPAEPAEDQEPAPAPAPTLSDIVVRDITKSSAAVAWTTDVPATGSVVFGTTTAYGSEAQNQFPGTTQRVVLVGLECGTTYHFSPLAGGLDGQLTNGGPASFATLPCDAAAISDVVIEAGVDSLTVSWVTDVPADALVLFGETTGYGSATYTPVMSTEHRLVINDLPCGAEFHLRMVSDAGVGVPTFTPNHVATTEPCVSDEPAPTDPAEPADQPAPEAPSDAGPGVEDPDPESPPTPDAPTPAPVIEEAPADEPPAEEPIADEHPVGGPADEPPTGDAPVDEPATDAPLTEEPTPEAPAPPSAEDEPTGDVA